MKEQKLNISFKILFREISEKCFGHVGRNCPSEASPLLVIGVLVYAGLDHCRWGDMEQLLVPR